MKLSLAVTRRSWKSVAKSVVIGTAVVGFYAPATQLRALPKDSDIRTYYSDAAHTIEVGEHQVLCTGETYNEGEVTEYFTDEFCSCGGPDCNTTSYP
jgi:hypothetical protein